jgi:hypothetical protein
MKNKFDKSRPELPEDDLDVLLRSAVWPEPDPSAIARLQERLNQCAIPRKNKSTARLAILVAALAVGLLISATIWAFQNRSSAEKPSIANSDATSPKPASPKATKSTIAASNHDNSPRKNVETHSMALDNSPITRPPTPYEALLFRIACDKRKAALTAMREQSADPSAKETAKDEKPKQNPPDHATLVRTMLARASVKALAQMVNAEENPDLQEEILVALLNRGDRQSVGAYLDIISQRTLADRALSALDRVKDPPTDVLFGFLRGEQTPRRLAAALALGRIDGPETSRKLFEMVCKNVSRQEAMVGLLASSGDDASRYVDFAKQNIALKGVLNGAQYQYRLISPNTL